MTEKGTFAPSNVTGCENSVTGCDQCLSGCVTGWTHFPKTPLRERKLEEVWKTALNPSHPSQQMSWKALDLRPACSSAGAKVDGCR